MHRLVLERALLRLALAHVAQDRRIQAVLGRDLAERDLHRQLAPGRRAHRALEQRAGERRKTDVGVAEQAGNEIRERRVEECRDRAPEEPRGRGIRSADDAALVDAQDAVARRLDDAFQQRVAALDADRIRKRAPGLLVERADGRRGEGRAEYERERHDLEHDARRRIEIECPARERRKAHTDERKVDAPATRGEQDRAAQRPRREHSEHRPFVRRPQDPGAHGFRRERLHDDARKRAVDGHGPHVAELDGGRPHVHGLAAQRGGVHAGIQHVDERHVSERRIQDRIIDGDAQVRRQRRLVGEHGLEHVLADRPRAAHLANEPVRVGLEDHGGEPRVLREARQRLGDRELAIRAGQRLKVAREHRRRIAPGRERALEQSIVFFARVRAEVDVDEHAFRFGRAQHLQQPRVMTARPRPLAERAQALCVDADDHDVGRALVREQRCARLGHRVLDAREPAGPV